MYVSSGCMTVMFSQKFLLNLFGKLIMCDYIRRKVIAYASILFEQSVRGSNVYQLSRHCYVFICSQLSINISF